MRRMTSVRTPEMTGTAGGEGRTCRLLFSVSLLLPAALFLAGLCEADSSHENWSYSKEGKHGPSQWHITYETCKGNFQSPVDLRGAVDAGNLSDLILHGYDMDLKNAVLVNNGHSVQLSSKGSEAWISGGCLGDHRYYFQQLHFHWGRDDAAQGSEHKLNGKAFPMEGHFVHRKGRYDSAADASRQQDGLAVLGVFYQISNSGLKEAKSLLKALRSLEQAGTNKDIKVESTLKLQALLPKNLRDFFCYRGSLTTPPCSEAVTWTVLEDAAPVTSTELDLFRKVRFTNGEVMVVDNFRPVQELKGRTIFFHSSSAHRQAASFPHHALFLLILSGLLLLRLSGHDATGG